MFLKEKAEEGSIEVEPVHRSYVYRNYVLTFLFFLAVVLSGTFIIYFLEKNERKLNVEFLETITRSVQQGLYSWMHDPLSDLYDWTTSPALLQSVSSLTRLPQEKSMLLNSSGCRAMRDFFFERLTVHKFEDFYFLSVDGTILCSSRKADVGEDTFIESLFPDRYRDLLNGKTVFLPPVHFNEIIGTEDVKQSAEALFIYAGAPVKKIDNRVAGFLLIQIAPDESFSKSAELVRFGNTGETYIFNKEGFVLSNVRFADKFIVPGTLPDEQNNRKNMSIRVRDPGVNLMAGEILDGDIDDRPLTKMAESALKGEPGNNPEGYNDFRGVRVIGAWLWDEELGVGIASEIEEEEILQGFRKSRNLLYVIYLFAAAFGYGFVYSFTNLYRETDRAIRLEKRFADKLIDSIPGLVFVFEEGTSLVRINHEETLKRTGYRASEVRGRSLEDWVEGAGKKYVNQLFEKALKDGTARGDLSIISRGGTVVPYHFAVAYFMIGGKGYLLAIGFDQDHMNKMERELVSYKMNLEKVVQERTESLRKEIDAHIKTEQNLKKLSLAVEESPVSVVITDAHGNIEYVNRKFCEITLYARAEVIGENPRILKSGYQNPEYYKEMWETISNGKEWFGEFKNRKKDGSFFWERVAIAPLFNSYGRISHYVGVKEDISMEKEMVSSLEQARKEADRANEAKSVFLSSMSHEIRTPMNSIIGYSELLASDEKNPLSEKQMEYVDRILRSGRNLLQLINDVLELARIETGKFEFVIEPVNLSSVCQDLFDVMSPYAAEKQVTLNMDNLSSDISVMADREGIRQTLIHLVSNGIKFNREGGHVSLECSVKNDHVVISVSDDGQGIDPEKIDRLFAPFDRLGAEASAIEGTGIGLTITRKMVEMMKGRIEVQTVPDQGSVFYIELPIAHVVPDERENTGSDRSSVEESNVNFTVLYVEDNEFNRDLLAAILARSPNISILTAEDGNEGVRVARESLPDVILMDINMGEMNGYQVLEILRNDARTSSIPVIAVSGNTLPQDINKALEAGFDQYLVKPFNVSELRKAMGELVMRSRGKRQ